MDRVKKTLGLVWMIMGPLAFFGLIYIAFRNINGTAKGDISNPVPWIIILCIFAPISLGLAIFGWYSWKGEYDNKTTSQEL